MRSGRPRIDPSAYVASSATVIGDVDVGARASVWPGAALRGDLDAIHVDAETNVQDNAVLHADPGHPCRVGRRVTVGHAAVLHGCRIEDDVLIGIGSIVLNGAIIGTGSVLAAGALVPEGAIVPSGSLVMGVPGRVSPIVDASLTARIDAAWRVYVDLAERATVRDRRS